MKKVLLVDDMVVYREPIAAVLEQSGYAPETAVNGKDAINKMRTSAPQLILLDVAMPEMDGLEFLRQIHMNPEWKEIPVVLVTAVSEKDYVLKARELGVRDCLVKSYFSLESLLEIVGKHLGPGELVS